MFLDAFEYANQEITFFAVGVHHQNCIAESHSKNISLGDRTVILHALRHWPESITTMLCTLAFLDVAERHHVLKFDADGKSSLEKISGVQGDVGIKHLHT